MSRNTRSERAIIAADQIWSGEVLETALREIKKALQEPTDWPTAYPRKGSADDE